MPDVHQILSDPDNVWFTAHCVRSTKDWPLFQAKFGHLLPPAVPLPTARRCRLAMEQHLVTPIGVSKVLRPGQIEPIDFLVTFTDANGTPGEARFLFHRVGKGNPPHWIAKQLHATGGPAELALDR